MKFKTIETHAKYIIVQPFPEDEIDKKIILGHYDGSIGDIDEALKQKFDNQLHNHIQNYDFTRVDFVDDGKIRVDIVRGLQ